MGKTRRERREEERDSFAAKRTAQKRGIALKALGILSVVAAISAWLILSQILGINNIIGCLLILSGVLLSQLAPIYEKNYVLALGNVPLIFLIVQDNQLHLYPSFFAPNLLIPLIYFLSILSVLGILFLFVQHLNMNFCRP